MVLDGCTKGAEVAASPPLSQATESSISPEPNNGTNRIARFVIFASFLMVYPLRISARIA